MTANSKLCLTKPFCQGLVMACQGDQCLPAIAESLIQQSSTF